MWNRILWWWRAEGDLAQLQGVSDRMLDDMGLSREDLRDRVMGESRPAPDATACLPAPRLVRS